MTIDERQVRHLAALARLRPDAGGEERLAAELGRIVEYVEHIGEVEEGPDRPEEMAAAPREEADAPRPPLPRERVLAAAPQVEDGLVKVPAPRPRDGDDG